MKHEYTAESNIKLSGWELDCYLMQSYGADLGHKLTMEEYHHLRETKGTEAHKELFKKWKSMKNKRKIPLKERDYIIDSPIISRVDEPTNPYDLDFEEVN